MGENPEHNESDGRSTEPYGGQGTSEDSLSAMTVASMFSVLLWQISGHLTRRILKKAMQIYQVKNSHI
jgi:hypothetical protein